ncbi:MULTISPECIES: hypothetical protein [Pseudomonas]|uniref:hypothetical protein n=1 Tax=Pseudomonas TaxID=286 RepID=UPI000B358E11|nr:MULTISPECIES: hypothetical protein [Pseudomonas]PMY49784.1 hypothetical protein C1X70_21210 [Pseudomonas sp. FW305-53]PMY86909.1 hypothetical protein C1X68_10980 [Pseudomonas sp. FW303-C2]PMY91946.1 hypothetical protein C1X67_16335 [Pseudomonas sp. FW305-62]PNA45950.1 hypothetical protein C1X71_04505 [Pseudomonas sp. FW306-2-2C-A10BC]PNA88772.1 hypothetical protein C1X66_05065 [Pseudomonas sp. MPR-R3B]
MNYVGTAFTQLAFAWKLYDYALEGKIDLNELDRPLMFQGGGMVLVLPDKVLDTPDDLLLALQNNLIITFGAAAITLNRCREEAGYRLPAEIQTEIDHFIGATYQIRNAFAHDIAEPRWNITKPRFARLYEFGGIQIDLTRVGTKEFEYQDIGGPDVLFLMKKYAEAHLWA